MYESDPEGGLVPLACALYSFRWWPPYRRELLGLREQLIDRADRLRKVLVEYTDFLPNVSEGHADSAETVAAYLEWMSRQSQLSTLERNRCCFAVAFLCYFGSLTAVVGSHTWCLLNLTNASAHLRPHFRESEILGLLREVERHALSVEDPRQRVRVCAKLGMLMSRIGHFSEGRFWGMQALRVGNVPMMVRAKALYALCSTIVRSLRTPAGR